MGGARFALRPSLAFRFLRCVIPDSRLPSGRFNNPIHMIHFEIAPEHESLC
jgi:hypothetical protein